MTEEKGEKKNRSKGSLLNDIADITETFIFSVFLVLLAFTYLLRISDVEGPSMEPTLHGEDRLIVSSLLFTPEHNDIVIIDSSSLEKLIVKRVIGLPGDSVDIDFESGIVSVNGVPVDEQLYIPDDDGSDPVLTADHFVNTLTTQNMGAFDTYPVDIPEGCVFVLGDNRNRSKDSKHQSVGLVSEDEIVGEVVLRISPFSDFGFVK